MCLAKDESEDGRRALSELCQAYYEPVMAYLRSMLRDAEAAGEMGHAFFAKMLAGGTIHTANPERGRFRFYLLGAVKHFVAHQREAGTRLRRGGCVTQLSLNVGTETGESPGLHVAEDERLSPDAVFDRQWAITVLARAMEVLRVECAGTEDEEARFERMRPWLLGEAGYGDQAAVAAELGLSAGAMKIAVHRMRQRFRQCVKEEIAGTLKDESAVEDEMRSLLAALGG